MFATDPQHVTRRKHSGLATCDLPRVVLFRFHTWAMVVGRLAVECLLVFEQGRYSTFEFDAVATAAPVAVRMDVYGSAIENVNLSHWKHFALACR